MKLTCSLAALQDGPVRLSGTLPAQEMDLVSLDPLIRIERPLAFELSVQLLGETLLMEGSLRLDVDCDCVRCLRPFVYPLRIDPWACVLPLQGEDRAPVVNEVVDLTPYVREDTLLGLPSHPLCEPDCRGIADRPMSEGRGPGGSHGTASAWTILDNLKLE